MTHEPPPAPPTEAAPRPSLPRRVAQRLLAFLGRRGLGARGLAALGLALAVLAALCLGLRHPGLAGLFGLLGLLLGQLAVTPPTDGRPPAAVSRGLAHLLSLVLASGYVAYAARVDDDLLLLLAFLALLLSALLPYLTSITPEDNPRRGAALWTGLDRQLLLLLGYGLGRPGPALVAVLAVASTDACLRVAALSDPPRPVPVPLQGLVDARGRLQPAVRIGAIVLVVLLVILLPQGGSWRF